MSAGETPLPSPSWLMSKFWQKTQRRLHQVKQIGPLPPPAAEAVLFTEVGGEAADPRVTASLTDSVTILQAVDPAVSGADLARPEEFEALRRPSEEHRLA